MSANSPKKQYKTPHPPDHTHLYKHSHLTPYKDSPNLYDSCDLAGEMFSVAMKLSVQLFASWLLSPEHEQIMQTNMQHKWTDHCEHSNQLQLTISVMVQQCLPRSCGIYWNGFGSPVSSSDGRRSWMKTWTELWMCGSRYGGVRNTIANYSTKTTRRATKITLQLSMIRYDRSQWTRKLSINIITITISSETVIINQ